MLAYWSAECALQVSNSNLFLCAWYKLEKHLFAHTYSHLLARSCVQSWMLLSELKALLSKDLSSYVLDWGLCTHRAFPSHICLPFPYYSGEVKCAAFCLCEYCTEQDSRIFAYATSLSACSYRSTGQWGRETAYVHALVIIKKVEQWLPEVTTTSKIK